jgi:accessory gene regulator B
MFRELSERLTIWGIHRGILRIEQRSVYEYGIEVILLNAGALFLCFLISLLENNLLFFGIMFLSFIPLRMSVGGKHASKCEICFISSIFFYWLLLKLSETGVWREHKAIWTLGMAVSLLFLWFVAPVKSKKRTYDGAGVEKKKKRARCVIIINLVCYGILYRFFPRGACCQSVLILGVTFVAAAGVVENVFGKRGTSISSGKGTA